ncbi:hypothetical protein OAJ57_01950 [Alphaproteobacteria bacterium]|nr:hypothetical protein [Alphaproteobacteria bacterium]
MAGTKRRASSVLPPVFLLHAPASAFPDDPPACHGKKLRKQSPELAGDGDRVLVRL